MLRALRWLVSFLERKFPDRVTVTAARYKGLEEAVAALGVAVGKQEDRMKGIEVNLLNLNTAIGFAAPKMGMLER